MKHSFSSVGFTMSRRDSFVFVKPLGDSYLAPAARPRMVHRTVLLDSLWIKGLGAPALAGRQVAGPGGIALADGGAFGDAVCGRLAGARGIVRGGAGVAPGCLRRRRRARLRGRLDLVELHAAHGYLMHQFLSPLSNRRTDAYGRDRMKFPLEVAAALREAWPKDRALGARISGNDWAEGGLGIEDGVAFAKALKAIGFDYVCVSSAALVPQQRLKAEPGYTKDRAWIHAAVERLESQHPLLDVLLPVVHAR